MEENVMFSLRSEEFIRFVEIDGVQKSLVRAEIDCDTSSDIPAYNAVPGRELVMGSIAWDISTGDFYGLDSSGEWVKQGTTTVEGE
jgi:hypothetical protein